MTNTPRLLPLLLVLIIAALTAPGCSSREAAIDCGCDPRQLDQKADRRSSRALQDEERARTATPEVQRRIYRRLIARFPDLPGVRTAYIRVANAKALIAIKADIRSRMAAKEDPSPREMFEDRMTLAFVHFRLGEYAEVTWLLQDRAMQDLVCSIASPEEKARFYNDLYISKVLQGGIICGYLGDPAIAVYQWDYQRTRGVLDSCILYSHDTVLLENHRAFNDLPGDPFPYACPARTPRAGPEQVRLRADSAERPCYCDSIEQLVDYRGLLAEVAPFGPTKIVLDASGSMLAVDDSARGISRLDLEKKILQCLTFDLADRPLGLITVQGCCGGKPAMHLPLGEYDTTAYRTQVSALMADGCTPLHERIEAAAEDLMRIEGERKLLLVLSDGVESCVRPMVSLCEQARRNRLHGIQTVVVDLVLDGKGAEDPRLMYECMVDGPGGCVMGFNGKGDLIKRRGSAPELPFFSVGKVVYRADFTPAQLKCVAKEAIVALIYPENPLWGSWYPQDAFSWLPPWKKH